MTETILRRIAIVCAFLVLLIPFIVTDSSFFPYIVGKAIAFRVLAGVMFAAWACLAVASPVYRPRWSPVMICSLVFLAVIGIADALGLNPLRSLWSNFERMEGFVTLFYVVAFLFAVGLVMRAEEVWNRFWNASIIASVIVSFIAFSEVNPTYPGELVRVDATLGNAIYLAVYLLINIFIAILLAYRARANKVLVGVYGCAIVVQLFALYYTGTRGAFLGLVVGLGLASLIMLVRGRNHPRMRRVAGVLIGLVVLGAGMFFTIRDSAFVQDNPTLARIANISLTDTTVESRITLWTKIGWNAFLERPLLGWGQDNFIIAFGKYYDPLMYKQEPWFDRAHNVFVDWAIAGGLLGLLAYLSLFGAAIWMLWKSRFSLPEKAILAGLLGAYACNNIFVFDNLVSYIYFAIVLAYLHARGSDVEEDDNRSKRQPISVSYYAVMSAVGVGMLALIWFTAVRPMGRAQTLLDALRADYTEPHDPAEVLTRYDASLAYGSITGLEETREQLSQSAIRAVNNENGAPESREALVNKALSELVVSASEEPDNTRRLYFLAHFLKEMGSLDEALTIFDEALSINPRRQNFLYEVAQIHLDQDDFDKVISTFKEAYDAEPENDKAFGYYAGALMFAGRDAEGEKLLVDRFGTTTVDNDLVFDAYKRAGRNDKIASILELRLREMNPIEEDPGTHVSLAIVYLDLGRKDDAIAQLERAAELKPEFAQQAEQMIAAIQAGRKIIIK